MSGDTGPLHIAAAAGTPVVALFGPTLAERNGPWSEDDITVSRTGQCKCLYQRRCRIGQPCINDIELREVLDAVQTRLRRPDAGGRVRIGHAAGILAGGAEAARTEGGWRITKVVASRSARRLMTGVVHPAPGMGEG